MDYSKYWSLTQQTISTLNNHRKLRFNSNNVQKIIQYFEIKPDKNLLDSGCGTGVLLESISNYYMNGISLTGVDRDSSFIEEANSKNISNSQFFIGDVLKSPFSSDSFEQAISYTLIEHIEPSYFLKDQFRILKSGGVIGIMTCTPPAKINKIPYYNEEEIIYNELYKNIIETEDQRNFEPFLLPAMLEECGFIDVDINTISLPILWDIDSLTINQKNDIVQHKAKEELGYIELIENKLLNNEFSSKLSELKSFVQKRLEKRLSDIEIGRKNWEIEMNYTLCIKARKP